MATSTKPDGASEKSRGIPLMSKLSKLPKKVVWTIFIFIVLVLAGGGGYFYYRSQTLASDTASTAEMQTSVARRGDLVIYASGTGTLISESETDLSFHASGEVTDVLVKVGDKVDAGALLAKLDETDAQIAYTQANRTYLELTSPSAIAAAQQSIADATASLDDARSHLAYVISPDVLRWEEKVSDAETAVANAQTEVNKSPSDSTAKQALEDAQSDLETAKSMLAKAQALYYSYYVPKYFRDGTEVSAPSDAEVLSARADMELAKATLQEAQYLYAALTGGDVPKDATGSGLTELEQARLDMESAKAALDGTRIISPISGTVMSIDISVGDSASSGTTVITVADLSQPYLEVYLDESDWSNVQVGYETEVTFDILPDQIFKGVVTQVDPGLYSSNNTSVVRVLVQLKEVDESTFNLPLGTTASVDVIAGRASNAVLVPIEAIHQAGDQYAVFVVENGTPVLHVVQVGIQDLLYAEITSGLEAGDVVTTGITETQ